ncbi:MAG: hypothetical protein R2800_00770 [Flavipsychrobacter sp.]
MKRTFILLTIAAFIFISAALSALRIYAPEYNYTVLMTGNIVLSLLSFISFMVVTRQINDKPDAFVRGVYASTFLKMIISMFAILIYVFINRDQLHKPTIFSLMGIYAVYSTIETWLLSKMARDTK